MLIYLTNAGNNASMQQFDSIVIGGGSGLNIASALAGKGEKVAIVEEGPLGGTCLNRGCIPSKIIIHSADVMDEIHNAERFGIKVSKNSEVNFKSITKRASEIVDEDAENIEQGIGQTENLTLFKSRGKFIGNKTMKIGDKEISADKVYIVAGTRPFIPPINGLEDVDYITSKEALRLETQPQSMAVIGGGYIAAELAHFYGALGTDVTILQRSEPLIKHEDEEIAETFTEIFSQKHNVMLRWSTDKVEQKGKGQNKKFNVHISHKDSQEKKTIEVDQVLVATGRVPNTDLLEVEKAGIETDANGFITVNEFMETSADNIWAAGDIAGIYLFKHSANLEAQHALRNSLHPDYKQPVDYTAMPHAIFSSPQIAGVSKTEDELQEEGRDYQVGKEYYKKTGMGVALQEEEGFVKLLVDPEDKTILGCHILGPGAPTLIHEVLVAMRAGSGTLYDITDTIHIHPALSEVVQRAANNAR